MRWLIFCVVCFLCVFMLGCCELVCDCCWLCYIVMLLCGVVVMVFVDVVVDVFEWFEDVGVDVVCGVDVCVFVVWVCGEV